MKLLLGIPAAPAAGQGYEPADHIKTIYDTIQNSTNFAGETIYCSFHYSFHSCCCRYNDVGRW
jgi:hypothetical protein